MSRFTQRGREEEMRLDVVSAEIIYRNAQESYPKTARVLRIEMQARDIPSDFPMDRVESAVDYSYDDCRGIVSASDPCRELGL